MIDRSTLTLEQLKVVNSNDKYILCSACPGSGKTQTLAARAQRLWEDYQQPILVCTFSNKASNDIRERIGVGLGMNVVVNTIHSLCFSIIKQHWNLVRDLYGGVDFNPEPLLMSDDHEIELINQIFPKSNASKMFERFVSLRAYGLPPTDIMVLVRKGVFFGTLNEVDLIQWRQYENERLARGCVNFDDMISICQTLLTFPDVSTKLARKYSHVLVDEAQDTSTSQWSILRLLMSTADTSLIVYDNNQAIYGWRGGDVGFIQSLGLLGEATKFSLTQNFRSGREIGAFANTVVKDKSSLIRTLDTHAQFSTQQCATRQEEVDFVLSELRTGAVLSRTNSYLELFERACLDRGIPYTGSGFYRSEHIMALADFLRSYDGSNVQSVVRMAFLENASYSKWERADLSAALKMVKEEGVSKLVERVDKSLALDSKGGLALMTGHSSKGLEWDEVCVVGAHVGNIPHKLSTDETEERNLFYVMVTRPRKKLLITCVDKFSPFIPYEARSRKG